MEAEDAPKRILYNMPKEMVGTDGEVGEAEEDLPLAPVKEAPQPGVPPSVPEPEHGDLPRWNALHLEGDAISELSTSRLLAFVGYSGTAAKGIEWINDTRCVIVFESYELAAQGLQRLCYDELQDLPETEESAASLLSLEPFLRPRLAMAFPRKLYTAQEIETADELPDLEQQLEDKRHSLEDAEDPKPEIYRDMELEEFERTLYSRDHQHVKKLRQSLWVRFALLQHDTKAPRSASRSNWYRQHGRGAGKEVVTRLLEVGDVAPSRRRRRGRGGGDGQRGGGDRYEEDYTPLSLRDRIGGRRSRDWDEEDTYGRLPRDRSQSPDRT